MSFIEVSKTTDIEKGTMKTIRVNGRVIAVANVDGEYFAIDDTCSHEHCSLGTEGFLDGATVICGCHGANFDVTNGKVLSLPAPMDVTSYKVKVEGEDIYVEM